MDADAPRLVLGATPVRLPELCRPERRSIRLLRLTKDSIALRAELARIEREKRRLCAELAQGLR